MAARPTESFRWRLEDEGATLFDLGYPERHVGRGEYRGLEFLHVKARTIINQVPPSSRMAFRYTINPYRGCTHACAYCMSGDTPVLMGDGGTKPLGELRPGDRVYGTVREGLNRHYVVTAVLAHWRTVKPAYLITLEDGTELVASGDHRFLSDRGWKYVTGAEQGRLRRPHLTPNNKLTGTGAFSSFRPIEATAVKSDAALGVVSIKPLGKRIEMFDITTGTGDFIANGVVSHNCFARPTHEYLGLGTGEDFERRIVVKVNAVELARAELSSPRWQGDLVAMGTNTDPYQHAEGKYHLTKGIVGALSEARNPFSILTKSTLILRDLEQLVEAATRTRVQVNFSVGTLDREVWKATEPGTPPPPKRLEAVRRLNEGGVPCGVLIAPVLPGLSDSDEQVTEVARACKEAGAKVAGVVALHLRPGVRQHYLSWLERARPDLIELYKERFARGSYQPSAEQERLSGLVRAAMAGGPPRGRRKPPVGVASKRSEAPAAGPRRHPREPRPPAEPRQLALFGGQSP